MYNTCSKIALSIFAYKFKINMGRERERKSEWTYRQVWKEIQQNVNSGFLLGW